VKIGIIVVAIVLLFGLFSTIFHDTSLVGNIGKMIGDTNLSLFGYIAYIDLLILFYPLYLFYRDPILLKRLDMYVGWVLMLLSLIMFQSLVVDSVDAGYVGREIVSTLSPLIGQAGLWLFWLMIFALSLVLVIDDEYDFRELAYRVQSWIQPNRQHQGSFYENDEQDSHTEQSTKLSSLKSLYSTLRDIFHNPFDLQRKEDINNILKMNLNESDEYTEPTQKIEQESILDSEYDLTAPHEERHIQSYDDEYAMYHSQRYTHSNDSMHEEPYSSTHDDSESSDYMPMRVKPKNTSIPADDTPRPRPIRPTRKIELEFDDTTSTPSHPKTSGVVRVDELETNTKILAQMDKGHIAKPKNFRLPKLDFLHKAPKTSKRINEAEIDMKIGELLEKLAQFRISGDVVRTYSGPLVTTFEFKPAPNVKVSKILGLQDDLAMALSAETIRIQAPIPGRDVVGIEIPNEAFDTIYLRDILEHKIFKESKSELTIALGKDIVGKPFVTDLKKLPHLLIAGTTGSGKSVGINAMILSLLYRNDPDHLKLVMIDPKMLEFSIYNDIPHLITPVITDAKKAIIALANLVAEMERRYRLMADNRVKNIENYNEKAKRDSALEHMPYIVIVIDELADLMMNGGKEVEYSIARLAQMARASGIHLIVATQRPSVDVVTGLIKANLPSRLSYRVGQRIDSKVILDQMGAESLLGRGDGLFTPPGTVGLVRIHAPWNTEDEIERVVESLKAQREPDYDESIVSATGADDGATEASGMVDLDPLYEQAKEVVLTDNKTSISYLQRKLQIGYNRSANIIDQLQKIGILSEPNAKGNREIL